MNNGFLSGLTAGLLTTTVAVVFVVWMMPMPGANFSQVRVEEPTDEIVACIDESVDEPGIMFGQFCRNFDSPQVNLRVSNAIPVAALRLLPSLTRIDAPGSEWGNLYPLLEFTDLTWLDLSDSTIGDFTALAEMTNLEALGLRDSNFTDLTPIAALSDLTILELTGLPVSDLTPLENLTKLRSLFLKDTDVVDLSPLAGMTRLRVLDLRNTAVKDLSPVQDINGLEIWR